MSTQKIARFVSEISINHLPPEVIIQIKKAIRDILGVSIAAHHDQAVNAARKMVATRGGAEESSLIGVMKRLPCDMAAFVNSVMASTLDMDDGSMGLPSHLRVHRGHPGGIVIPAGLAVAEKVKATGAQLIEAVAVGYEVAMLTAWLTGETMLAGVNGTFGATAASSKLLGLNVNQTIEALNIASAHRPAPSYAFIWTRIGMTKESAAWAAMTGVTAALLAQNGFSGTPSFYDLEEHDKAPLEALGRDWEIMSLYFKPYSACRHAHAPIDGVLEVMAENDLEAGDIAKVIIGCASKKGLFMSNRRPTSIWQAQYSIPFLIGAAIIEKEVGPQQVSEKRLEDASILRQADKVNLIADAEVDALQPGNFAARVTIQTKAGRIYETFIRYPRGEPENPLSDRELEEKFKKLSKGIISAERVKTLLECLENLDQQDSLDLLIKQVADFSPRT
jgi:2-methylcitrate dehydratase PrpD